VREWNDEDMGSMFEGVKPLMEDTGTELRRLGFLATPKRLPEGPAKEET